MTRCDAARLLTAIAGTLRASASSQTNPRSALQAKGAVRQGRGDRRVPIERCGNRPRSSTVRVTLLVLAWLLTSSCLADIVMLDNGDRVTGRVQRIESGKLVIA